MIDFGYRIRIQLLATAASFWLAGSACAAQDQVLRAALDFDRAFAAAVQSNDLAKLEQYLAPEWRIISGDGAVISRARFLQVIASGELQHDGIAMSEEQAWRYGNIVIITNRAKSSGSFRGAAFSTDEMSTDIIAKRDGTWRCVLTQLSSIAH